MKSQRLAAQTSNAEADAVARLLDGGWLDILDGAQAADPETGLSGQHVLATLRFQNPSAPAAANGVATLFGLTEESDAPRSGTATWFRAYRADHATPVFDGSVGTTSDFNLTLSSVAIQLHAIVRVAAFEYRSARS